MKIETTETKLIHGDCLEKLKELPDCSVDSVVTDPPYGLSFMGKKWDYDVPSVEVWKECLRVLRPGGHLLAFAGTRTQHRMAVRIEDAGFEIRDMIAWCYGSGFPKSLDVSKAIDKAAGAERERIGRKKSARDCPRREGWKRPHHLDPDSNSKFITAPATDAAKQWQGWGTALKPALEPITVARKPLAGTVAGNVLEHGTGAINVDGCRVGAQGGTRKSGPPSYKTGTSLAGSLDGSLNGGGCESINAGRWPANLIHDGSEEVVGLFPSPHGAGAARSGSASPRTSKVNMFGVEHDTGNMHRFGDSGSAARFFYCAKASKRDRDEGYEGIAERLTMRYGEKAQGPLPQQTPSKPVPQRNHHPTVKPTDLMRYLCRLVTPPGGVVLDPFMGSGSTGKAAVIEGFNFIGIEREESYMEIAEARINPAKKAIHKSSGKTFDEIKAAKP
jgi:site-specific DNA-methyltransferase (adenine-specific)